MMTTGAAEVSPEKTSSSTCCALCSTPVGDHCVADGDSDSLFCCHGCQAVYRILTAQGTVNNFREQPVFRQALRAGIINNPDLLAELKAEENDDHNTRRLHLDVDGMWCPSCAMLIELLLRRRRGVVHASVDYATDLAVIEYHPEQIGPEAIIEEISSAGYSPERLEQAGQRQAGRGLVLRFGVAAFCALNIMMLSYPLYAAYFSSGAGEQGLLFAWLSALLAIPTLTYSAWPIYRRFWAGLKVGLLGMETLVVVGVSAALIVSAVELWQGGIHVYFDSMTVIIAFVLLGKVVEARAKFSSKDALLRLSRGLPRRGRRRDSAGNTTWVTVKEVAVGDELVAAAGERVVMDGVVVEGEGSCDESLLTGEAIPVRKGLHDQVVSGAVVKQGWLVYRVTRLVQDTALQQIVDMVQQDLGAKSQYTRAVDVIVRIFIPAVALLALCAGIYAYLFPPVGMTPLPAAMLRAMSVLLISCPCAVGIAAPLAEARIINRLASWGMLVRNRACLPRLAKTSRLVLDKTGTVTEGRFVVTTGLEPFKEGQLGLLRGIACHSSHPICVAIAEAIATPPSPPCEVCEVAGRGISGKAGGHRIHIGSRAYFLSVGITIPDTPILSSGVTTAVEVAVDGQWKSTLWLGDTVRPEVQQVVQQLTTLRPLLLSGDGEAAVAGTAKAVGIDQWRAAQTPLDKREVILALQEKDETVCMVGDGINDAPCLTAADVGIATLAAADMSVQVSDVLMTTPTLDRLPALFAMAREGQQLVRQNLVWAFSYNVIGIGLAVAGKLNPLMAAIAMVCSSLIVLGNSLRGGRHLYP